MKSTLQKTVGQYVEENFRTAAIFKKHNINFCCQSGKGLEEVCKEKNIDYQDIIQEIEGVVYSSSEERNMDTYPIDLLVDYIEKTYHNYIIEKSPILLQFLDKLCRVHGDRHPELLSVRELFGEMDTDFKDTFTKKEKILYPYIRSLTKSDSESKQIDCPQFKTVEDPILVMKNNHIKQKERFEKIASLTDNYTPPVDACNTYRVTFAMLKEFQDNAHQYAYTENNILFPKAINIEKDK